MLCAYHDGEMLTGIGTYRIDDLTLLSQLHYIVPSDLEI